MTTDTQKAQILNDLLTGATITPLYAWRNYGCSKLSTRCGELVKQGFPIDRKRVKVKTRRGYVSVMSYFIDNSKKK